MAEPKTEDQLNFLTSLAYVEEMATGVQGWWVGLADLGHEGEWVWQVRYHPKFGLFFTRNIIVVEAGRL